jgi:hypothetical protein
MKDETLLTEKTADYAWEISAFRRRIVQRGLTDGMRAALQSGNSAQPVTVPAGYALVPIEPTPEMMLHKSGCQHHAWNDPDCPMRETRRLVWSHMLAAAPKVAP